MTQAVLFGRRAIAWPFCIAIALSILSGSALAQGSAGQIDGTVRDEQAGVLPGVYADAPQPGHRRHPHDRPPKRDGRFVFSALAPGRYTLRAELSGFGIAGSRRTSPSPSASSSARTSR